MTITMMTITMMGEGLNHIKTLILLVCVFLNIATCGLYATDSSLIKDEGKVTEKRIKEKEKILKEAREKERKEEEKKRMMRESNKRDEKRKGEFINPRLHSSHY